MGVEIFLPDNGFVSFGYIPRSGIAGSYSQSIFNFMGNLHTAFCSDVTILYFRQCPEVLFSISPTLLSLNLDNRRHKRCEILVLFFISLMISDAQHFSHTCWPLHLLGRMSLQDLCLFLNWVNNLFFLPFSSSLFFSFFFCYSCIF